VKLDESMMVVVIVGMVDSFILPCIRIWGYDISRMCDISGARLRIGFPLLVTSFDLITLNASI
jgi:hypothetical protein